MSAGKVVLIVFGVIGFMAVGTCAVCSMVVGGAAKSVSDGVQKREDQEKAKIEKAKSCKTTEEAPLQGYQKVMAKNEAAFVAEWKDQCWKVSGVVDSISAGMRDAPTVLIDNGGQMEFNKLHCEPADAAKANKLKAGQKITVWGLGGNEIAGSLFLEGCDW